MNKCLAIVVLLSTFVCAAQEQKPIVVIIPSYNNAQWYQRNLDSVCFQTYDNYHVVYVDDCSTDGTGDLVQSYIDEHQLHEKVTLMRNEHNHGALYNLYDVIHQCADNVIIVTLDGDDWLKHNKVLERVNQEYQNPDVWLTYGQFETYPHCKRGFCRSINPAVINKRAFRETDWVASHLRTFYAGLFKQIKLQDLIFDRELFRVTWDMAFMFPMLEMSNGRFSFIPDILYVYNEDTPLNDFKLRLIKQLRCSKIICAKEKYAPIDSYMQTRARLAPVDVVLFGSDDQAIGNMLNKLYDFDFQVASYTIFPEAISKRKLGRLQKKFQSVKFIASTQGWMNALHGLCCQDGYLFVVSDRDVLDVDISIDDALQALEKTKALSFNFGLSPQLKQHELLKREMKQPAFTEASDDYYAWHFYQSELDWRKPLSLHMNLVRKADFKAAIKGARCRSIAELETVLHEHAFDVESIGLCRKQGFARRGFNRIDNYKNEILAELEVLLSRGYRMTASGCLIKLNEKGEI